MSIFFYRFLWLAESHHGINLLLDITKVSLLPEFFVLTSHSLGPYHVQRWIISRHATPPITPPGSDEGLAIWVAIWVAIWAAINATPRVREIWWYCCGMWGHCGHGHVGTLSGLAVWGVGLCESSDMHLIVWGVGQWPPHLRVSNIIMLCLWIILLQK